FTQLNLRLGEEDLMYVMEDAEVSVVMVDETLVPMMEAIPTQTEHVKHWVILSDEKIDHNLPNAVYYEDLIAQVEPLEKWPNISEDSAFAAGYTTGTTGRPKGVFYSHRSQFLHAYAFINGLNVTPFDVVMPITPMFHVLTWGTIQAAVLAGSKLVLPGLFSADTLGD